MKFNVDLGAMEVYGLLNNLILYLMYYYWEKHWECGMPLGAFVADKKMMDVLSHNPVLGHINTFGGHPVSCAAGLEAFKILIEENWIDRVNEKEKLFVETLQAVINELSYSNKIHIRSKGLMIAVEFESFEINKGVIDALIESKDGGIAVFSDWFLFASNCLRIAPPLTITDSDIQLACARIRQVLMSLPVNT
jgi:acetylornithine/succinyldiaminopimelate/putrescine aminotransferase